MLDSKRTPTRWFVFEGGSLAVTLDALTLAATATVPVNGTLDSTLDALTLAATGTTGGAVSTVLLLHQLGTPRVGMGL